MSKKKKSPFGALERYASPLEFSGSVVVNRDLSLTFPIQVAGVAEESLDASGFQQLYERTALLCRDLPAGTRLKKIDFYEPERVHEEALEGTLIARETQLAQNGMERMQRATALLLTFFVPKNPWKVSLKGGGVPLPKRILEVQELGRRFLAGLPKVLGASEMDETAYTRCWLRYFSLSSAEASIDLYRAGNYLRSSNQYIGGAQLLGESAELTFCNTSDRGLPRAPLHAVGHAWKVPHMVVQELEMLDTEEAFDAEIKEWRKVSKYVLAREKKDTCERATQGLLNLKEEATTQEERPVSSSCTVFVWDKDASRLKDLATEARNRLVSTQAHARILGEELEAAFLAGSPSIQAREFWHPMFLTAGLAQMDFCIPYRGAVQGIRLSDRYDNPLRYDPLRITEGKSNNHALVFGESGSGKSLFNGKMIKDRVLNGQQVMIIDVGGTYRHLCAALGGKYVEYSMDSPVRINPFLMDQEAMQAGLRWAKDLSREKGQEAANEGESNKSSALERFSDKLTFLTNLVALVWRKDLAVNPLSDEEEESLGCLLERYFAGLEEGAIPSLRGLSTWLNDPDLNQDLKYIDLERFKFMLGRFVSKYGHLFEGEAEGGFDDQLVFFELGAVEKKPRLYRVVVQAVFDRINRMALRDVSQPTFLDVEEAWSLLGGASQSYIESIFRTGRKNGISIRLVTQSVEELRKSEICAAVIDNVSTRILLCNSDQESRDRAAQFLGLTDLERIQYAALSSKSALMGGYRDILIREGDSSRIWRFAPSLFELGTLTSHAPDRERIKKLTAAHQGNIEWGISAWVDEVLAAHNPKFRRFLEEEAATHQQRIVLCQKTA